MNASTIRVKFNDLPQPVRERLIAVLTANPRDPRVITFAPATVLAGLSKFGLVASLFAIVLPLRFMISRVKEYGIGSDWITYLILGIGTFVFLSSLATRVIERVWPRGPYRTGMWALPGTILETDQGWLEITPTSALGKPTILTVKRRGEYQHSELQLGGKLTFSFGSPETVEAIATRILETKAQVAALVAAGDLAALAKVDPFAECRLSGVWGRPGALSIQGPTAVPRPSTRLLQWYAPAVLALAVAIGANLAVTHFAAIRSDELEAEKAAARGR